MKKQFVLFACLAILFSACQTKSDYDKIFRDPNLYCNTVHELNTVVMGNNFGPIVASRNYMYAAVAGYEAMAAGYPDQYQSLGGQLHGLKVIARPAQGLSIDYELASLLAFCKLGEAV